jgi:hypothetical protein
MRSSAERSAGDRDKQLPSSHVSLPRKELGAELPGFVELMIIRS